MSLSDTSILINIVQDAYMFYYARAAAYLTGFFREFYL